MWLRGEEEGRGAATPGSGSLTSSPRRAIVAVLWARAPRRLGNEVSPVPAGEPVPGEVLPGVRDTAGASVLERNPAAGRGQVLLQMRDARQRAWVAAAARLARGLYAET